MCGRYYRKSDKQQIAKAFRTSKVDDFVLPPWDYNVVMVGFVTLLTPITCLPATIKLGPDGSTISTALTR